MVQRPHGSGINIFLRLRSGTGFAVKISLQHAQDPRHMADGVAPKRVRPGLSGGIAGAGQTAGRFAG
jgi:hypothetical protein